MKVFLAGSCSRKWVYDGLDVRERICVLESYISLMNGKNSWMIPRIRGCWDFLLDSGAFTFMRNRKNKVDWERYIASYAEFINENNIQNFFELDIDVVVGLREVERLRTMLENQTAKKCIPVWHRDRGLNYWEKMVVEYEYVAIGGIVTGEIKKKEFPIFGLMLKTARENGCKVHGLGLTSIAAMRKYRFYSVDSTSWVQGNKGGFVYIFDGKGFVTYNAPVGKQLSAREAAIHNFREWVKFQKYAEAFL